MLPLWSPHSPHDMANCSFMDLGIDQRDLPLAESICRDKVPAQEVSTYLGIVVSAATLAWSCLHLYLGHGNGQGLIQSPTPASHGVLGTCLAIMQRVKGLLQLQHQICQPSRGPQTLSSTSDRLISLCSGCHQTSFPLSSFSSLHKAEAPLPSSQEPHPHQHTGCCLQSGEKRGFTWFLPAATGCTGNPVLLLTHSQVFCIRSIPFLFQASWVCYSLFESYCDLGTGMDKHQPPENSTF